MPTIAITVISNNILSHMVMDVSDFSSPSLLNECNKLQENAKFQSVENAVLRRDALAYIGTPGRDVGLRTGKTFSTPEEMIVVRLLMGEGDETVMEDGLAILGLEMFCRVKKHLVTPVVRLISAMPKVVTAAEEFMPRGMVLFINLRGHELDSELASALIP
jgi:hypothetical protein